MIDATQSASNKLKYSIELTVMLPTKQEAGTITEVIGGVHETCRQFGVPYEILVVDAGSTDNTQDLAAERGARVIRQKRPQYAGAILDGIDAASAETIIVLDADGSHPPETIADLWAVRDEADLGIASRFVPGSVSDMNFFRYIFSRILNFVFYIFLWVPVRDMSSGFRLYHKSMMQKYNFTGGNLSMLQDIVTKLHVNGHRIVEVPLHYKPRDAGQSKTQVFRYGLSHLYTLLRLIGYRHFGIGRN